MGWSSWNRYGSTVSQEKVLAQARAMVDTGLRDCGYLYVNIDDGWQGERGGLFNALQGNSRFPNMQGLCDAIHSLGLKVGIYSTPWPRSYAGFPGSAGHEREDARQWSRWGIDFVKYDWAMNDPDQPSETYVKRIRQAIDETGSPMVLSLSNTAPISGAPIWSRYANMWRTTGDLTDTWECLSAIGFGQNSWKSYAGPGRWNDPDMMVLGVVGWGEPPRPSRLTPDEQVTHMTLWCMLAAPLILGCDLTRMNDRLRRIVTNPEVIAVDQDPLGVQGHTIHVDGPLEIWIKPLKRGAKALAFFNRGDSEFTVPVDPRPLGLSGDPLLRDLWARTPLGRISERLELTIRPHGSRLLECFAE